MLRCRCRCCLKLSGASSLHAGARYVLPNSQSLASLDKALLQVRRQLGNQERGKEDDFGKALLSDVTAHGLREARLCPQLRKIKVTASDGGNRVTLILVESRPGRM